MERFYGWLLVLNIFDIFISSDVWGGGVQREVKYACKEQGHSINKVASALQESFQIPSEYAIVIRSSC